MDDVSENLLVGFGFCLDSGELFFLDMRNVQSQKSGVMQILAPIMEDKIKKIVINCQFVLESLFQSLWEIDDIISLEDPIIASWINNTERDLSFKHVLSDFLMDIDSSYDKCDSTDDPKDHSIRVFYSDLQYSIALYQIIMASIDDREKACYEDLDIPCAILLSRLKQRGLSIDITLIQSYNQLYPVYLHNLEERMKQILGDISFNINHPNSIITKLNTILTLPTPLTNDTLDLESILHLHPVIPLIIEYQSIQKIITTLLNPLVELINESTTSDISIKTHWNLLTKSGHLECNNYNFNDIPKEPVILNRNGISTTIDMKKCFKPPSGYQFIGFKYSHLELRIAAHFSEDKQLIELFTSDKDPIQFFAQKWFNNSIISNNDLKKTEIALKGIIL